MKGSALHLTNLIEEYRIKEELSRDFGVTVETQIVG